MADPLSVAGIVLAGGASRRFGSPKPLANFKDKSFVDLSVETLMPVSDCVIVVTREEIMRDVKKIQSKPVKDVLWIKDVNRFKESGPLAGIYSAMIRIKADYYLVSPCDMPLMKSAMYEKWLGYAQEHECDCVIPVVNGKVYPLNGIYKPTCIREVFACLSTKSFKVMEVLDRLNTTYLDVEKREEKFFINVNTKEHLNLLQ